MSSKLVVFTVVVLTGCGGSSFSSFEAPAGDGQAVVATDAGGDAQAAPPGTGGAPSVADSGTGGATSEAGSGSSSGGSAASTGGVSSGGAESGGTSSGGAETGGAASGGAHSSGGETSAGGKPSTGGASGSGGGSTCASLVTHSNGLGQTWQDCMPLDTYDSTQATKACEASGAEKCLSALCGAICAGGGASLDCSGACWGYTGAVIGRVGLPNSSGCSCPDSTSSNQWH